MNIQQIRERITTAIKESGQTQEKIAKYLGVRQTTVSEYVRHKSLPALDTLAKLCVCLDISADYILGIEDYSGKKNIR